MLDCKLLKVRYVRRKFRVLKGLRKWPFGPPLPTPPVMKFTAFEGEDEPMRPELVNMLTLIESQNKKAGLSWILMGVQELIYDNKRCFLLWKMGVGAKFDRVKFTYDEGLDLYDLDFFGHAANNYASYEETLTIDKRKAEAKQRNKVLTRLCAEDIVPIIERETGFYLSL